VKVAEKVPSVAPAQTVVHVADALEVDVVPRPFVRVEQDIDPMGLPPVVKRVVAVFARVRVVEHAQARVPVEAHQGFERRVGPSLVFGKLRVAGRKARRVGASWKERPAHEDTTGQQDKDHSEHAGLPPRVSLTCFYAIYILLSTLHTFYGNASLPRHDGPGRTTSRAEASKVPGEGSMTEVAFSQDRKSACR